MVEASSAMSHRQILAGLADLLESVGYGVTEIESRGCRRPRLIEGHRPDLVADRLPLRARVIGEVKTGADLETGHSHSQFRAFSRVMLPTIPVTYAGFILAVPLAALSDAWAALRSSGARLAKVTVIGQAGELWLITFLRRPEAGSWQESGLAIRVRRWPFGARSTRRA